MVRPISNIFFQLVLIEQFCVCLFQGNSDCFEVLSEDCTFEGKI